MHESQTSCVWLQDCTPVPDNVTFAVDSLFPANKSYYSYSGSLTTPPCTEGIIWVVFMQPIAVGGH